MFLEQVIEKCHNNLLRKSSKIPLAYLISRGVTFEEIKRHKIGYISKIFTNIKETDEDSKNFNAWLGKNGYFVSERIVFPIYDEIGKPKGIETRGLDKRAMHVLLDKYKKSLAPLISKLPESSIRYKKFYLDKSKFSACFFGIPESLDEIWKKRTVFLTEGIFDCNSLKKIHMNSLSSLTANIGDYQLNWLKRYCDRVILLFDMDKKGKKAVSKIKKDLQEDMLIYSINLKGSDVNEYTCKYGIKELKLLIEDNLSRFF